LQQLFDEFQVFIVATLHFTMGFLGNGNLRIRDTMYPELIGCFRP